MRLMYTFLLIIICSCLSGCAPPAFTVEDKMALVQPEEQRSILAKEINSITLIVNSSPRIQVGIPQLFPIEDVIAKIRKVIEKNKFVVTEVILTQQSVTVPYVDYGTAIGAKYFADPQLFEQVIPQEIKGDAAYVVLLDCSDLENKQLKDTEIYISGALGLLRNKKRIGVRNIGINWDSVKVDLTASAFIMPVMLINRVNAEQANAYQYIFDRKIPIYADRLTYSIFSDARDMKSKK